VPGCRHSDHSCEACVAATRLKCWHPVRDSAGKAWNHQWGSESAEFHECLVIDGKDVILEKPRFGAFHCTDLELLLRSRGIDTIMVTGISTNVCCETTAREAAIRHFHVLFVEDATATFWHWRTVGGSDPEGHVRNHRFCIRKLVVSVEQLMRSVSAANHAAADRAADDCCGIARGGFLANCCRVQTALDDG
jgi:hypothetical protein